MAHQGDVGGGLFHGVRDDRGKFAAFERETGFVAAHSGTAPSRQHIPGARPGASHALFSLKEMITLGFQSLSGFRGGAARHSGFRDKIGKNILRHICFNILIAGFGAGALFGASAEETAAA